jgi:hypothetical protein
MEARLHLHDSGAGLGHPESVPDACRNLRDRRSCAHLCAARDLGRWRRTSRGCRGPAASPASPIAQDGDATRRSRLRYDDQPLTSLAPKAERESEGSPAFCSRLQRAVRSGGNGSLLNGPSPMVRAVRSQTRCCPHIPALLFTRFLLPLARPTPH